MRSAVNDQQFKEEFIVILRLLQDQADYNADSQKPVAGPFQLRTEKDGAYLRKLEEIDSSWVARYLRDALIGIKLHDYGGVKELRMNNQVSPVFIDEDEGSPVDMADLSLEENIYSEIEIMEARNKLPYLLKRMHDKSVMLKTSVISLMQAYYTASRSSKGNIKPKDIIDAGVYQMDKNGYITQYYGVNANTGAAFRNAKAWIMGEEDKRDSYYRDSLELKRVCDILGIDFMKEDPKQYQADTIAKMRITYVQKNREYLSGPRDYNPNVIDALNSIGIDDYQMRPAAEPSLQDRMLSTIQLFIETDKGEIKKALNRELTDKDWTQFFYAFDKHNTNIRVLYSLHQRMRHAKCSEKMANLKVVPSIGDFYTSEGFLCIPGNNGLIQTFYIQPFLPQDKSAKLGIVHTSGYLVAVDDGTWPLVIDVLTLAKYINDHYDAKTGKIDYTEPCEGWETWKL